MGKPTGFIEWERGLPRQRPVGERITDYREIPTAHSREGLRRQAGRCMDCGVPFCQQGCPLGNPIPDFNDHVYHGRLETAFRVLDSTNNFPEFTGRLCPAPCEAACTLAVNQAPVTIEQVEKEIVEHAFANGWVTSQAPTRMTGRRVAIVGSGPAGLAAAAQLRRAGHEVTVFERDDRIGGLLRYGIPDFKLEKAIIDRRLALLEAAGIRFVTGAAVGVEPRWTTLTAEHDAVLVAVGSRRPRDLQVPGRELKGVCFAMDFLERQNRLVAGDDDGDPSLDVAGKRVIILGGGDTGSDCLGTAHRQGAAHVIQIELLPRPPEERRSDNPWPTWPLVFRTSSSQAEGGERQFALLTKRLSGEGGQVTALHAVTVELTEGKLVEQGPEQVFPVDQVILAMGFVGPDVQPLVDQLGIALDQRGNIQCESYATAVPGVYAAGDARRGQSLIVWAIMEGREAARAIDAQLRGEKSSLPTRGLDQPFG